MNRRQRLGQHFLISENIARGMVDAAGVTKSDTILEVGTGRGILTGLLCERAGAVISYEADRRLYEEALSTMRAKNLDLRYGDGIGAADKFDVFVSSLPYSRSREAVEWLIQRDFGRGVIMVQSEFAAKLACTGARRRAIGVLAGQAFEITRIMGAGRANFDPPPGVDSVVLKLARRRTLPARTIRAVNGMFSYRRKTLQNMLGRLGVQSGDRRRLDDLGGGEIIEIAGRIR